MIFFLLLLLIALLPLAVDSLAPRPYEPIKIALFESGVALTLLVVGVLGFFKKLKTTPITWTTLDFWVVANTVIQGIAMLGSVDSRLSFFGSFERRLGFLFILALTATYFLVRLYGSETDWQRFFRAVFVVVIGVSLYALAQRFGFDHPGLRGSFPLYGQSGPERVFATLGHPNFLGLWLAMIFPLGVYFARREVFFWRRIAFVALPFSVFAILLTYSRGAWLAFLAGTFSQALFWKRRAKIFSVVVAGAFLGGVFLTQLPAGKSFGERALSSFDWSRGSALARKNEWRFAIELLKERPILGYGQETYALFSRRRVKGPLETAPDFHEADPSIADRLHNIWLDTLWNSGLAGLLALLGLLGAAVLQLRALFVKDRSRATPILGVLTAWLVGNQVGFDFSISSIWLFLLFTQLSSDKPPVA